MLTWCVCVLPLITFSMKHYDDSFIYSCIHSGCPVPVQRPLLPPTIIELVRYLNISKYRVYYYVSSIDQYNKYCVQPALILTLPCYSFTVVSPSPVIIARCVTVVSPSRHHHPSPLLVTVARHPFPIVSPLPIARHRRQSLSPIARHCCPSCHHCPSHHRRPSPSPVASHVAIARHITVARRVTVASPLQRLLPAREHERRRDDRGSREYELADPVADPRPRGPEHAGDEQHEGRRLLPAA